MKALYLLLGLFVWLASVGTAYFFGLNLNKEEAPEIRVVRQAAPDAPAKDKPSTSRKPETSGDKVAAIMELSREDLEEALRQTGDLNEAEQRALLEEAFALPENNYRRASMIRDLLAQLAETAPLDALAQAQEIGSLRDIERARIGILEVWAGNDPVAALSWARTELANEPLRTQSSQILAIYRGYAMNNPKAAFTAAMDMPAENRAEERIQDNVLEAIIEQQIENGGLLDAKLQVELLEDGPRKESLLSELVDEWASYDPESAAAYVDSLGDEVHGSIKARLVGEWAENDPEAAAAWLSSREVDAQTLGRASTAIIREWTRYDMAASAEWLNTQPSSPELDRAVMSYTYRASQEDPANAMTWAESINSDHLRRRMMRHVAANWKDDDLESFQNYIDRSELSEEEKTQLQESRSLHDRHRWWR